MLRTLCFDKLFGRSLQPPRRQQIRAEETQQFGSQAKTGQLADNRLDSRTIGRPHSVGQQSVIQPGKAVAGAGKKSVRQANSWPARQTSGWPDKHSNRWSPGKQSIGLGGKQSMGEANDHLARQTALGKAIPLVKQAAVWPDKQA